VSAAPPSGPAAAAAHLRTLPLGAILRFAWERLPRYGPGARLPRDLLTPEACGALESVLGERIRASRPPALARLDAALRASPFACGLPEALEAMFGPPPQGPSAAAAETEAAFQRFAAQVEDAWPDGGSIAGAARTALRREFLRARRAGGGAEEALATAARAVGAALARIGAQPQAVASPLPVLANEVAHDPHAFDADTPGGRLLTVALAGRPALTVADRQALLAEAGLAVDGISSTAAVFGIAPRNDPAARAAAAAGQVHVAPLRAVAGWDLEPATWAGRTVHTAENPAVFESVVDRGLPPRTALLCTSGFPSAAALALLRALGAAGALVRHSGDFDVGGLLIARRVLGAAGPAAGLWRMAPGDYRNACAVAPGRPLRPDERRSLEAMAGAADGGGEGYEPAEGAGAVAACAAAVLAGGRVAYQEALIPVLWGDLAGG